MPAPLVLDDFLPYRLSYTSNLVSALIAGSYRAQFALTIPEWRVIAVVAETAGTNQQAIGRATRMDKVTVSRAVIALVDRGLVARAADDADRRSQRLTLSPAGERLYSEIAPRARDWEARIFAGFSPAEQAAFAATLRRIDAAVLAIDASD